MMETLPAAILVACFGACVWFMICNDRTLIQRRRLIHLWRASEDFWRAADEFEAVTYDQHLLALVLFRDPMKLYGPLTQQTAHRLIDERSK